MHSIEINNQSRHGKSGNSHIMNVHSFSKCKGCKKTYVNQSGVINEWLIVVSFETEFELNIKSTVTVTILVLLH
jgi:uncharacterized membrane protein